MGKQVGKKAFRHAHRKKRFYKEGRAFGYHEWSTGNKYAQMYIFFFIKMKIRLLFNFSLSNDFFRKAEVG